MQEHLKTLERYDARVVALSADDEEGARTVVDAEGLTFDVAYGLDPEETSRRIGCYTGRRKGEPHIQPASFVLKPDGTIALAVYSTGKVGRLTAADAVTVLKGMED